MLQWDVNLAEKRRAYIVCTQERVEGGKGALPSPQERLQTAYMRASYLLLLPFFFERVWCPEGLASASCTRMEHLTCLESALSLSLVLVALEILWYTYS